MNPSLLTEGKVPLRKENMILLHINVGSLPVALPKVLWLNVRVTVRSEKGEYPDLSVTLGAENGMRLTTIRL